MTITGSAVDREKLRAVVRKLEGENLYILIDRAIDLLPSCDLLQLIEGYAWPEQLRDDGATPNRQGV